MHGVAAGGLDVSGLDLVPEGEPLLLCSNHMSNFDPLVLGATVSRVMYAMAKAELFRNPLLGAYLRACNCFPVKRDRTDVQALRAALAILSSGGVVVMYPEGHRSDGAPMRRFNPGAGYLAHKSGVRVLPSAIWGTERVLRRGRLLPARAFIHLRFGEPFLPIGPGPGPVTLDIERRVAALLPPALRPSADPVQGDREDQG